MAFYSNNAWTTIQSTKVVKRVNFLIFNNIIHCETPPQSPLQPLTFISIFILNYFIATVFILGFNGDRELHNDSYNDFYLNNK